MVPFLFSPRSENPLTSSYSQQRNGLEETLFSGKRVVIVEDEGITQMHLRKILTRAGLLVVSYALNGAEGVATVLRERPDLVLMDINMPGEINGLEAARQILAQYHVCIVMITAYPDHREQAEQLGACGYALKPVDSVSLLPELQRAWKRFPRY